MCVACVVHLRYHDKIFPTNAWHMVLHWTGLIAAIYLISVFVSRGIVNNREVELFILIILALDLYLTGHLYTGIIFILIGYSHLAF
ncbi:hypothetical protein [Coxiella-like endosymbiont]|uniref:hypothetical protein n=1 Tax=Coxiella-like endosymbiont TaxID=1592897 RepID=UPI00272D6AD6|nr:hypothetical protein [Coxiella-like endosymbiont]